MKNIHIITLHKHSDTANYKQVEPGIFICLEDEDEANHRMALSFELEEGEDTQYPLEDVLDEFYLHVSDFLESEPPVAENIMRLELGGTLEDVQKVRSIIGKRVYNQNFVADDGKTRVKLIIE